MWIIKHGNTYKEIDCPHCKAKLAYYLADIKHDVVMDRFIKEREITNYIVCAECHKKITIKKFKEKY